MNTDERLLNDQEILKKYTPVTDTTELRQELKRLWQESQQNPSFAAREHFVNYQVGDLQILIKINTSHPFIWSNNIDGRLMPKNVKETIARFLWEDAGEKERNAPDSFEQWRDDKNGQWLDDLSRKERELLVEGGVLGSLPPNPIASKDATLTTAKLPAPIKALEAQQAGFAAFTDYAAAAFDKLVQQPPAAPIGLLSKVSVFAPKPQAPSKPVAPTSTSKVDPTPEARSGRKQGP